MTTEWEFKANCDLCNGVFTKDDLADPTGVVRLRFIGEADPQVGGGYWHVVGFGSGRGEAFVHARCLVKKGTRIDIPIAD